MPNQDIIFAIAKDTNIGAKSADGSTWYASNIGASHQYKGLGGIVGKFVYLDFDPLRKYSINSFTIVDNTTWYPSVMPAPQAPCIVAIAENSSSLFYSYNGTNFIQGPPSV